MSIDRRGSNIRAIGENPSIPQYPILGYSSTVWYAGPMKKSIRTPNQVHLQELLKTIRHESSLTQSDVAKRLDKPQSFVSKYESGERRLDLPELRDVCLALRITLVELVTRFEEDLEDRKAGR